MLHLYFAAERYWVQNVMALIPAIVQVPRATFALLYPFPEETTTCWCTQYMATPLVFLISKSF
jgi:hypothetical protein